MGNNLDNTRGIEAAVVTFASIALLRIHNLILSNWGLMDERRGAVWRSSANNADLSQRLIRYDSRHPDIIFREGFLPRGFQRHTDIDRMSWDLVNYVTFGRIENTPFVSTSYTELNANGELIMFTPAIQYLHDVTYIYEIFAPGGIDINQSLGEMSPYRFQREIAFPGGIRPEFIRSARQIRVNRQLVRLEAERIWVNPNFIPYIDVDLPEIIIPEGVEVVNWDPKDSNHTRAQFSEIMTEEIDLMKRPGELKPDFVENDVNYTRRIPDGVYKICSTINKDIVLDASREGKIPRPIIAWENLGNSNQQWQFTYNSSENNYQISSVEDPNLLLSWNFSSSGDNLFALEEETVDGNTLTNWVLGIVK